MASNNPPGYLILRIPAGSVIPPIGQVQVSFPGPNGTQINITAETLEPTEGSVLSMMESIRRDRRFAIRATVARPEVARQARIAQTERMPKATTQFKQAANTGTPPAEAKPAKGPKKSEPKVRSDHESKALNELVVAKNDLTKVSRAIKDADPSFNPVAKGFKWVAGNPTFDLLQGDENAEVRSVIQRYSVALERRNRALEALHRIRKEESRESPIPPDPRNVQSTSEQAKKADEASKAKSSEKPPVKSKPVRPKGLPAKSPPK